MDAFIDGDIVTYKAGFSAEKDGGELAHSLGNTKRIISKLVDDLNGTFRIDNVYVYLTADSKSGYRYDVAKTKPYKGNRKSPRPKHYNEIREYLVKYHGAEVVSDREADDEMGITASVAPKFSIIVSADKDLRMIPGWHYEMGERPPYYVTDPGYLVLEEQGNKPYLFGTGYAWFCAQCIMGDTSDNIPGLEKYGPVATYDLLRRWKTTDDLDNLVLAEYEKNGVADRLDEVKELLWIQRKERKSGMSLIAL